MSCNTNAIHLSESDQDKINWYDLSCNPNATHLSENNQEKTNWVFLSGNPNTILLGKRRWFLLSANPGINELNYEWIKERTDMIHPLPSHSLHPLSA